MPSFFWFNPFSYFGSNETKKICGSLPAAAEQWFTATPRTTMGTKYILHTTQGCWKQGGWALGVKYWVGMTNTVHRSKFGFNLTIRIITPNWTHFWGWVRPPGSEFGFNQGQVGLRAQKFIRLSVSSFPGHIQSTMIDENGQLFTINYVSSNWFYILNLKSPKLL